MKKAITTVLIMCVLFSLTACGTVSQQDEIQAVTEYDTENDVDADESQKPEKTDNEEETQGEVDNTSSNVVKNADGTYTYTVYGSIQLNLKLNIDDYIVHNDDGWEIFHIYDLAKDCGWCPDAMYCDKYEEINQSENGGINLAPSKYVYPFDNGRDENGWVTGNIEELNCWTYWDDKDYIGQYRHGEIIPERPIDHPQLREISISTGRRDSSVTYDETVTIGLEKHYSEAQYYVWWFKDGGSISSFWASREDIIIIAYIMASPDKDGNPFDRAEFDRYKIDNSNDQWEWGVDYVFP